jgi:glutathione S-transferase
MKKSLARRQFIVGAAAVASASIVKKVVAAPKEEAKEGTSGTNILTIYHVENTRAERIIWLCEEIKMPYKLEVVMGDGRASMEKIRAINPLMTMAPTVVWGGQMLVESGAIVEWILAERGDTQLRPSPKSPDFPLYLQWLHFAEGSAMPRLFAAYFFNSIPCKADFAPIVRSQVRGDERIMAFTEDYLGKYPYFGGQQFSAADIMMHFPIEMSVLLNGFDLSKFPKITAWRARVEERPAFKKMMVIAFAKGKRMQAPPVPAIDRSKFS